MCEIAGRKKDITEAHIQSIYKLLQGTGSKECMLPYQVHVYKQYEWVKIEKSEAERGISQAKYMELPELPVDIPSVVDVPGLGRVEFRTFPCEKNLKLFLKKPYTKWFDYDKITRIMCLRPRQAGDYLTVNQQMGRKIPAGLLCRSENSERKQKFPVCSCYGSPCSLGSGTADQRVF